MRCRGVGSTYHSQTLSVALWSETLACGTAWTSTVEELWAAPGRPGSKSSSLMAAGMVLTLWLTSPGLL
jgi:uncharacterized membrane protein